MSDDSRKRKRDSDFMPYIHSNVGKFPDFSQKEQAVELKKNLNFGKQEKSQKQPKKPQVICFDQQSVGYGKQQGKGKQQETPIITTLIHQVKVAKEMLIITTWHRNAMAIANGSKIFENRSVRCNSFGLAYIHEAKRKLKPEDRILPATFGEANKNAMELAIAEAACRYGQIVAVVRVVASLTLAQALASDEFTDEQKQHINGPFCHVLKDVERIPPGLFFKGGQGGFRKVPKVENDRILLFLKNTT